MRKTTLCLTTMLVLWSASLALAQFAALVSDPVTEAQTGLTALRTLASNVNEVKMINQQIQQLANDAKNLARLPLSVVSDIQQSMTTYQGLLNQGRTIAYQAKSSLAAFDQLFSNGKIPLTQRAQAIYDEIRNTGRLATEVQSIYDELCAATARVEQLGHASDAAIGELQATQAGNQLLAVLAEQQNGIRESQASMGRLQTLVAMQGVVEDEAAKARVEHMLSDWPTTTTSQGFKLP